MASWWEFLGSEPVIRLVSFLSVFLVMALWEALAPRRQLSHGRPGRWFSNLGLVLINTLALRVIVPMGAVGAALLATEQGWGFFNTVHIPEWLAIVLCVIVLDLVIYLQHVLFHAVPALWRLHMVHHADLDIDVTTGLRFHTIEILLSMGVKLAAVLLLGAPALAVLFFEVLLNATSLFNHSNVRMPCWLDQLVRLVVVTPDMHRVHHSVIPRETNSNFGFNLPWWDYLLGTYRAAPEAGHTQMTVGVAQFRDSRAVRLLWMLALPFVGSGVRYPLNDDANREPLEVKTGPRTTTRFTSPTASPH